MTQWAKHSWKGTEQAPSEQAYLGNGLIGWRLSANPLDRDGRVYVGGFAGVEEPEGVITTIEIPNPLHIQVRFDPKQPTKITALGQSLDIHSACLDSEMMVEGSLGQRAYVKTQHVAYRNVPCTIGLSMEITPEQDGSMELRLCSQKPRGHGILKDVCVATRTRVHEAEMRMEWEDPQARHRCGAMIVPVIEDNTLDVAYHAMSSGSCMGTDQLSVELKHLKAGQSYRIHWLMSMVSSESHLEPTRQAGRMLQWCFKGLGVTELLEGHKSQWAEIWKSRIIIEGDDESQKAIDGSMFYLHSSIHPSSKHSMPPFGLSANTYYGHVFWDCETWMFPPILLQAPSSAKSMLEFRLAGLDQATKNASLFGYEGAMFPWEASAYGYEDTPMWGETGYMEHHIVPDVAYAFWQYQCVTQDEEFLHRGTWPVLREVANWVCSRVEKTSRGYEIRHVTSADEFSMNVDNSAHTNLACVKALQIAIACSEKVGLSAPASWSEVANNMFIPRLDDGTIAQHGGWTPEWISKQADTTLAIYPLGIIEDPEEIKKVIKGHIKTDLNAICTVAMGDQINAVVSARHGDRSFAKKVWDRGWKPYWIDSWGMYGETVKRTPGCFVTGCGGLVQAVLLGFTGLQLDKAHIAHHPVAMPEGWESIRCEQIYLGGKAYRLYAEQGKDKAVLEEVG